MCIYKVLPFLFKLPDILEPRTYAAGIGYMYDTDPGFLQLPQARPNTNEVHIYAHLIIYMMPWS